MAWLLKLTRMEVTTIRALPNSPTNPFINILKISAKDKLLTFLFVGHQLGQIRSAVDSPYPIELECVPKKSAKYGLYAMTS